MANNIGEHAEGRYNVSHFAAAEWGNAGNTIHSVGIGSPSQTLEFENSKNAFEIMQNGDAYLYGVGGYDGTNPTDATRLQDAIGGGGGGSGLTEITYAELKSLRDSGSLVPGSQYRITNYHTTTVQENTQSADHQFDIIVTADSESVLNENARAAIHEGDTYFSEAGAKLEAWEIKYCLDNDTARFLWADTTNGKGIIYYMKDEWCNECPYDFKNMQFQRKLTDGQLDTESGTDTWVYTFNAYDQDNTTIVDATLLNTTRIGDAGCCCKNNSMKEYSFEYSEDDTFNCIRLNDNVFLNLYSVADESYFECYSNTFGSNCQYDTFGGGCYSNAFGDGCNNNSFGFDCSYNSFGNYCKYNSFGDGCGNNPFGNYCWDNTFDEYCTDNSFGSSCSNNSFGSGCSNNSFGSGCSNNSYGSECTNNIFGSNCYKNTFGGECTDNTFGSNCNENTFGSNCNENTFGTSCSYNSFDEYCAVKHFEYTSSKSNISGSTPEFWFNEEKKW